MELSFSEVQNFQSLVLDFYDKNQRDLPWRRTEDAYAILVSEMMLQQTQVSRVIEKYKNWIRRFPSVFELARASLEEVLSLWTGLGYNRRARYLLDTAIDIVDNHHGVFPTSVEALVRLPGVGSYTASAVCVFAHNFPLPLIETNVRTVMIHHFFPDRDSVADKDLLSLVEQTIDRDNPRRWFNALFDYGAFIKTNTINPSRKSKHYMKQSPLKGSVREVRGWIMKRFSEDRQVLIVDVQKAFGNSDRVKKAIDGLIKDALLKKSDVI